MKLFLCSQASQSLDKILEYLPKPADMSRVAWIPDAADVHGYQTNLDEDYHRYKEYGFDIEILRLKNSTGVGIRRTLERCDLIHVGGGNAYYLLQEIRRSGFDQLLGQALSDGKPYVGSSAGSAVTGPSIDPLAPMDQPDAAPMLESTAGLGLVDFVTIPHVGNEAFEPTSSKIVSGVYGSTFKLVGLQDSQVAYVNDGALKVL